MTVTTQSQPGRFWKRFLLWFVGPLLSVAIVGTGAVLNPPEDLILTQIQREFVSRTGLQITFSDKSRVVLLPEPFVEFVDLRLLRLMATGDAPAVEIGETDLLRVRLDPATLLTGNVIATDVLMEGPSIALSTADLRRLDAAQGRSSGGRSLSAAKVRITKGMFSFARDIDINPIVRVGIEDLTLTQLSAAGIGNFAGELRWREEPVKVSGGLARKPDGAPSDLRIVMSSPRMELDFDGAAKAAKSLAAGRVTLKTKSISDALALLNIAPRLHKLEGPAEITGQFTFEDYALRWRDATFKTRSAAGRMSVDLTTVDDRFRLIGKIDWDTFNIDQAFGLQAPTMALSVVSVSPVADVVLPSTLDAVAGYLDGLARPPAIGLTARAAEPPPKLSPLWSRVIFDPASLTGFDADLDQTAKHLIAKGYTLRDIALKSRLMRGALDVSVARMSLAEGRVSGRVAIDSRPATPTISADLRGRSLSVRSVLAPLAFTSLVRGDGDVDLSLTGAGTTLESLVPTLRGTVDLSLAKGRLIGFDLKRAIRQWWQPWKYSAANSTPYERIDAKLRINDGVVRTLGPASLRGQDVEIDAAGDIMLMRQSVNQRVNIRLAPPPISFPIPVRITGSWRAPKVALDFGAFSDPTVLYDLPPSFAPGAPRVPDELRAKISATLADQQRAARIPEKLRVILERLLQN